MTDVKRGVIRKGQKGYSEPLLCSDCEALISRYERHSRRLFVDPLPVHVAGSRRIREHPRLDYAQFELFCLSIIWRASVSRIPLFKHVALGPHEDSIRGMLLSGDAGESLTYPTQVFALHFMGEHLRDFLVEPTYMMVEGRRCYRFVMMGFVVFVYVAGHKIPIEQQQLVIAPEQTVRTFDIELEEFEFLRRVWNKARGNAN